MANLSNPASLVSSASADPIVVIDGEKYTCHVTDQNGAVQQIAETALRNFVKMLTYARSNKDSSWVNFRGKTIVTLSEDAGPSALLRAVVTHDDASTAPVLEVQEQDRLVTDHTQTLSIAETMRAVWSPPSAAPPAAAPIAPSSTLSALASRISSAVFPDPRNEAGMQKFKISLFGIRRAYEAHLRQTSGASADVAAWRNDFPAFNRALSILLDEAKQYANTPDGAKRQYHDFIVQFRLALESAGEGSDCRLCLDRMAAALYFNDQMPEYLEGYMTEALQSTGRPPPEFPLGQTLAELAEHIQTANSALEHVGRPFQQNLVTQTLGKLRGAIGIGFDPTSQENVPWKFMTYPMGKGTELVVLRHGNPTIGDQVTPEYQAFLRWLETKHKNLLYVNHQTKKGGLEGGAETRRRNAITALQGPHENFQVLSLPMDGVLWDKPSINRDAFIDQLVTAVTREQHGFALPSKLVRSNLPQKCGDIADHVKVSFFQDEAPWTIDTQREFLLLFYSAFKDYLSVQLEIDVMNVTCKDDKDRGNASKLVDLVRRAYLSGQDLDPDTQRAIFFAAINPFVIKNESIIERGRLKVALDVMRRMSPLLDTTRQSQTAHEAAHLTGFGSKTSDNMSSPPALRVISPSSDLTKAFQSWDLRSPFIVQYPMPLSATGDKLFTVNGGWNLQKLQSQLIADFKRGMFIPETGKPQYPSQQIRDVDAVQTQFAEEAFAYMVADLEIPDLNWIGSSVHVTNEVHRKLCQLRLMQQGALADITTPMLLKTIKAPAIRYESSPQSFRRRMNAQGQWIGMDYELYLRRTNSSTERSFGPVYQCKGHIDFATGQALVSITPVPPDQLPPEWAPKQEPREE